MKKRIFCTAFVLLLTAAVACTEADIQNIKNGTNEVIVLDTDNLPAPDIKKTNTDNDNNTDNGDKDTNDTSAVTSGNTEITDNTDALPNETEVVKPSLDDYVIEEIEGEYVLIKSAVVRSGPSTDFDKLGTIQADSVIEITGASENGWVRFEFESNDGFINQKFFVEKEKYDEELAVNTEDNNQNDNNETVNDSNNNETVNNNDNNNNSNSLSAQIVAICNDYRAAEGLDPLLEDPELDALAEIRADEIIIYFEHERPDGSDCFTVMKDYKCTLCGENIAAGQGDPKDVVEAWMNSPGHRANIMNKDFKKIGVGYSEGGEYGKYWAQLFAD